MHTQIEFTREELYELVWSRPVLAIAKEIGVSDVALAKACRKVGIPLPGRGHWAAQKSGRSLKRPSLPKAKPEQMTIVYFTVSTNTPPRPEKVMGPAVPPVQVPVLLSKPHRLVAEAQSAAKMASEDKGVLLLNYQKVLRVRVSAQQLTRALILMDVLIKQFESHGYRVQIGPQNTETILVLKEGEVSFRLDERTKQTPPPPPPPRTAARRHEPYYEPWRPAYILVGTGEFTLEFGKYSLGGCRRVWKDRSGSALEAHLHEIIEEIPSWEAALRAGRIEREEYAAKAKDAEERRIAAARDQEVLRLQRARLVAKMIAWERAKRLRDFISAAEGAGDHSPEMVVWLEWATKQINLLDPLQSDLSAAIDLEVKLAEYYRGPSPWEKPERDWWG
jgi:hypothetical protein